MPIITTLLIAAMKEEGKAHVMLHRLAFSSHLLRRRHAPLRLPMTQHHILRLISPPPLLLCHLPRIAATPRMRRGGQRLLLRAPPPRRRFCGECSKLLRHSSHGLTAEEKEPIRTTTMTTLRVAVPTTSTTTRTRLLPLSLLRRSLLKLKSSHDIWQR